MKRATYIVLATHNAEAFLGEQLDSLLTQSESDWILLVRDDHSLDKTPEILAEYAGQDSRIRVMLPPGRRIGNAASNFAGLLQQAFKRGAGYVFCCDQDDIWAPNKLKRMQMAVRDAEGQERVPCLAHHDLVVVDERLEPVAESLWRLMALHPGSESRPERLLSRNEVTGCALVCNRALLEAALPIPDAAVMHDWWLALFAAAIGRLVPVPELLVSYRQHGSNVIGARSYRSGLNPLQNWRSTWRRGNEEFLATVRQARAFKAMLAGRESVDARLLDSLAAYVELPTSGRLGRLGSLAKARVWRGNVLLDVVLVLRMLLLPRASAGSDPAERR